MISAILVGVFLVKLGFAKDDIGDFEWFLFLTNACSFFWSIGFLNAFKSFYPKLADGQKKRLIFNLLGMFCLAASIAVGIIRFTSFGIDLNNDGHFLYFGLFLIFGIPASVTEHILIVKHRAGELFVYGLVSYIPYLLGVITCALFFRSISSIFLFLVCWSMVRFFYALIVISRYGQFGFDWQLVKKFSVFALPLILTVLVGGGMEYVDGYLVDTYFSRGDFTVFRFGARELPINTVLITAMVGTMIPYATSDLPAALVDTKKRVTGLMHWLFPLSALLIMISPLMYVQIYSSEFLESAFIFNIYLLILCSRISLPQLVLFAMHKNGIMLVIGAVELLVNISLSIYFMSYFGLLGIAFATVIAYALQKILMIIYCNSKLNIHVSQYLPLRLLFGYSILLYSAFFISYLLYNV